jgi:hypothetical protein
MIFSRRKFNGAIDPYWDTPEGQAETGGHATFDHHLGGGTAKQAFEAARQEVELAKCAASPSEYRNAIQAIERGDAEFSYLQDKYEIFGTNNPEDAKPGVRNFNDRRVRDNMEVGIDEKGRIVRADGMVRKGWRWAKP